MLLITPHHQSKMASALEFSFARTGLIYSSKQGNPFCVQQNLPLLKPVRGRHPPRRRAAQGDELDPLPVGHHGALGPFHGRLLGQLDEVHAPQVRALPLLWEQEGSFGRFYRR